MFIKKVSLGVAGTSLAAIILFAAQPTGAQTSSQAERLEKLERAVEQLQKRNAELEQEISSLKKLRRRRCLRFRGTVWSDCDR
jgi:phage shock protein A